MHYKNNVFNCILNRSITSWIFKMIFKLILSDHCNIDLGNSFVITGGDPGTSTVSYYTSRGWMKDLASMNTGRYAHGCSSFTNSNQQEVWIKYIMSSCGVASIFPLTFLAVYSISTGCSYKLSRKKLM